MATRKQLLYVNRKAPHGSSYALESLEVVLVGAAFDQDVRLAFLDDGVFQLTRQQNTEAIGTKNFSPTYGALGDYEIRHIYVEQESLAARNLGVDDLLPLSYEDEQDNWKRKSMIEIVSADDLAGIMDRADVILSF